MKRLDEILDNPRRGNGAYRVPEGYFDTLNKRIMDSLPAEEKQPARTLFVSLPRLRYAAAACLVGVVLGVGALAFHYNSDTGDTQLAQTPAQQGALSEEYIKECMDYAMLDKDDVYMYLAEQ